MPPKVQRLFPNSNIAKMVPKECRGPDDCEGQRCLQLTRELSVCDSPLPEATECAATTADPVSDECGCDGLICQPDQFCRTEQQTCYCAGYYFNVCIEKPCERPADCADGSVCIPSQFVVNERCLVPECTADADCTDAPGGVCGLKINDPNQAGTTWVGPIQCFYASQP
jgi:hypothetical protein